MDRSWVLTTTAAPPAFACTQSAEQGVLADRVDAVERLVEQQQARLGDQRAGQQHPLALPAGQRAEPVLRPGRRARPRPAPRARRPGRRGPGVRSQPTCR